MSNRDRDRDSGRRSYDNDKYQNNNNNDNNNQHQSLPFGLDEKSLAPSSMSRMSKDRLQEFTSGSSIRSNGSNDRRKQQEIDKKRKDDDDVAKSYDDFVNEFDSNENNSKSYNNNNNNNYKKRYDNSNNDKKSRYMNNNNNYNNNNNNNSNDGYNNKNSNYNNHNNNNYNNNKYDKNDRFNDKDRNSNNNDNYDSRNNNNNNNIDKEDRSYKNNYNPNYQKHNNNSNTHNSNYNKHNNNNSGNNSNYKSHYASNSGSNISFNHNYKNFKFHKYQNQTPQQRKASEELFEKGELENDKKEEYISLYVAGVNQEFANENEIRRKFEPYGPIAAFRVIIPKNEDDKKNGVNFGMLVTFQYHLDAVSARLNFDPKEKLRNIDSRLCWAKTQVRPIQESSDHKNSDTQVTHHNSHQNTHQNNNNINSTNSYHNNNNNSNYHNSNKEHSSSSSTSHQKNYTPHVQSHVPNIAVKFPKNPYIKYIIDTLASYVYKEGFPFEKSIIEKERNNPDFKFLFESDSIEFYYYSWKVYSLFNGDSMTSWSSNSQQMVYEGPKFYPPDTIDSQKSSNTPIKSSNTMSGNRNSSGRDNNYYDGSNSSMGGSNTKNRDYKDRDKDQSTNKRDRSNSTHRDYHSSSSSRNDRDRDSRDSRDRRSDSNSSNRSYDRDNKDSRDSRDSSSRSYDRDSRDSRDNSNRYDRDSRNTSKYDRDNRDNKDSKFREYKDRDNDLSNSTSGKNNSNTSTTVNTSSKQNVKDLSNQHKSEFDEILEYLNYSTQKIKEAMIFCIDHSESSYVIVDTITRSIMESSVQEGIKSKVAKLFLISDILNNCTVQVHNVSSYRGLFEQRLPIIFNNLNETYRNIVGRVTAQNFKEKIIQVLSSWDKLAIYSKNYILGLKFTFTVKKQDLLNIPIENKEQQQQQQQQHPQDDDIDGVPLTENASTLQEMEGFCKLNGLLRGKFDEMKRKISLFEEFKAEEQQKEVSLQDPVNIDYDKIEEELEEYRKRILLSKASLGMDAINKNIQQYRDTLIHTQIQRSKLKKELEESQVLATASSRNRSEKVNQNY